MSKGFTFQSSEETLPDKAPLAVYDFQMSYEQARYHVSNHARSCLSLTNGVRDKAGSWVESQPSGGVKFSVEVRKASPSSGHPAREHFKNSMI